MRGCRHREAEDASVSRPHDADESSRAGSLPQDRGTKTELRMNAHQIGKIVAAGAGLCQGAVEFRGRDVIAGAAGRTNCLTVGTQGRDTRIPLVRTRTAFAGPEAIIVE